MEGNREETWALRCPECQSTRFNIQFVKRTWMEYEVDSEEIGLVRVQEVDSEIQDTLGWGGLYCAHCGEPIDEEEDNWEKIDELWELIP